MSSNILIFVISAFCLGAIMVMSKDKIPPRLKRGMAIVSIAMILFAFFLILYSFFTL